MGAFTALASQPRVVGRYVLYDEIASGGMGSVFLARLVGPVGFARMLAVKRPHRHLLEDRNAVSMFIDEARLTSRIRHPNVVSVHDIVVQTDDLLLVMEYVHGAPVSRLARLERERGRSVPVGIAAALAIGVLHGLHAAHEATSELGAPLGLVHRDVSPQNILVGADGVPRVVDFGIAKAAERLQSTTEGQLKGKAAYLAPEQVNGGTVDRRADVYATSVVLWEMLAGRPLFEDGTAYETLRRVIEAAHRSPSRYQDGVPPGLDEVVMRGLAADPTERFATARDMAIALEGATRHASAREIGEWVEELAGDQLRARASRIAELERASSQSVVRVAAPAPRDEISTVLESPRAIDAVGQGPPSSRRRGWLVAAMGGLGLAIAATVTWQIAARSPSSQAVAPAEPAPLPSPPSRPEPPPPPAAAPAAPPSPVHAPPRPQPAHVRAPAARASSKPAASARCARPFDIAADGTKIPRPECL